MEPPATTEAEWWRRHSSQGHKAGTLAVLDAGVSGRRVSFKLPRWLSSSRVGSCESRFGQNTTRKGVGAARQNTGGEGDDNIQECTTSCNEEQVLRSHQFRQEASHLSLHGDGDLGTGRTEMRMTACSVKWQLNCPGSRMHFTTRLREHEDEMVPIAIGVGVANYDPRPR